jgi:hypothetical protein
MDGPISCSWSRQIQLGDTTRRTKLLDDSADFVGLGHCALQDSAPHIKPGKTLREEKKAERDKQKINTCDDEDIMIDSNINHDTRQGWREVPQKLLREGQEVNTSSSEYLLALLEKWVDPCNTEETR